VIPILLEVHPRSVGVPASAGVNSEVNLPARPRSDVLRMFRAPAAERRVSEVPAAAAGGLDREFMAGNGTSTSWLTRHEFLIRRLHSLAGLVPVGAYMVVHLMVNASVLGGAAVFQKNVDSIHSLGPLLPLVEWTFIFIPILFHGILGVVIIAGGLPNTTHYPHTANIRYTLQRATGVLAFAFIAYHIWHLHHYGSSTGGGHFDPQHAASSTALALQPVWVKMLYAVGMLSCVYHLANGLWTMGITWGVWVSPAAQLRATWVCTAAGILLAAAGLSALVGFDELDVPQARQIEDRMETWREYATGAAAPGVEIPGSEVQPANK